MPVRFSSKSPEHGWLSNFSEHGFQIEGVRWRSVEHYYQARKFQGLAVADQIRLAQTPLKARKLGQNRSLTPRQDWDEVKETVMRQALRAKFDQNRLLLEKLLATGDDELIHTSSSDLYWGRSEDGAGFNRLGEILMELRNSLRSRGSNAA